MDAETKREIDRLSAKVSRLNAVVAALVGSVELSTDALLAIREAASGAAQAAVGTDAIVNAVRMRRV